MSRLFVLTPKPSATPRINGAKIVGVRPGSPFLFSVAATGERPLAYQAEGLPEGLRLDAGHRHRHRTVLTPGASIA